MKKCQYCGKEIPPQDPLYPTPANMHNKCVVKIQEEMEELGMIEVIWRKGTKFAWKFTKSFEKFLYDTIDFTHKHILHDETVNDDIIDMQGVIKAVQNYVPNSTSDVKVGFYVQFIFDSMMMLKYGRPLPHDKRFASRAKEFLQEIYSMPISEKEAKLFKALRRKFKP